MLTNTFENELFFDKKISSDNLRQFKKKFLVYSTIINVFKKVLFSRSLGSRSLKKKIPKYLFLKKPIAYENKKKIAISN